MIRRGGKWQEQLYTLFPSYIFVSTPDVYRVYYAVRDEDGVLHWLGATKGTPEALSAREEANILWLAGDGPLPPSEAEVQADGTQRTYFRGFWLASRRKWRSLPLKYSPQFCTTP